MTTDEEFIQFIENCNEYELLNIISENPEYLTDSYYSDFRYALNERIDYFIDLNKSKIRDI